MLNDSHCHFFSTHFFTALSRQRGHGETAGALCQALQWDDPGTPDDLADRWVKELDAHGVARSALIASVPGDEASVAAAVARHPGRFVGFFMVDPSAEQAADRVTHAITGLGLRVACLFPAMHHVPLADARIERIVEAVAAQPGTAVFVHCGVLSVGVRKKLGLPSRFDLSLGDPLSLTRLALAFPRLPFIVPHFGAGMLRETMMAADACPNIHVDTSSSNSWIRYAPGWTLPRRLQDRACPSSDRRVCCSGPTRRSSLAAGSGRSTSPRRPQLPRPGSARVIRRSSSVVTSTGCFRGSGPCSGGSLDPSQPFRSLYESDRRT